MLRSVRILGLLALLLVLLPALLPAAPAAAHEPITAWTRVFGAGSDASANAIALDRLGNVYVAGEMERDLPGQPGIAYTSDAFVRQYHPDGSEGWTRQFGSSAGDLATGVAVDPAGNVYVVGAVLDGTLPGQTKAGAVDAFVRQFHADGSDGWTHQFGSVTDDTAEGVAVDPAGNVYVAGQTWGALPGLASAGNADAFVRQYYPDGSEGWSRQFGSAGSDAAWAIAVDGLGTVYVGGETGAALPGMNAIGGYSDAFVRQYHPDGAEGWTHQFGTAEASDIAKGIATDGAGAVYVAGETYGALYPGGNLGGWDVFVRKLAPADGADVWTRQFGSADDERATGLAADVAGNVVVAGYTWGVLPGQAGAAPADAFVREYSANGSIPWTRQFGTNVIDVPRGVAIDGSGDVYVAGSLWGAGSDTAFVVKLRPAESPTANPTTPVAPFPSESSRAYFPPTGHSLALGFKTYWERNGGLPVFGYPVTEEFSENELTVQYTERQRFEYHPELRGTPYEVELGRLGVTDAQRRGVSGTPPFQPLPAGTQSDANCTFFKETSHRLCFGFKSYWQAHGLDMGDPGTSLRESLALFGYPTSEEYVDPDAGLVTQYFERAVFEYHPNNPEPYRVLLRRLGADELQARGWMP